MSLLMHSHRRPPSSHIVNDDVPGADAGYLGWPRCQPKFQLPKNRKQKLSVCSSPFKRGTARKRHPYVPGPQQPWQHKNACLTCRKYTEVGGRSGGRAMGKSPQHSWLSLASPTKTTPLTLAAGCPCATLDPGAGKHYFHVSRHQPPGAEPMPSPTRVTFLGRKLDQDMPQK
jgi:hypothetical protein